MRTVLRAHLSIGQVLGSAGRKLEAIQEFHRAVDGGVQQRAENPSATAPRDFLGNAYDAIASTYAELAAATKNKVDAIRFWGDTRMWAQKDTWRDPRVAGWSAIAKDEMNTVAALLARCEVELAARGTLH